MAHLSVTQALAGFFAAIGLYNMLISFVTSDRAFLWYAALMNSLAAVQFVYAPNLIGISPGEAFFVYRSVTFGLFFLCEVIFAWHFLRLPLRFPRYARAAMVLLGLNVLLLGFDHMHGPSLLQRALDRGLFLGLLVACAGAAWNGKSSGQEDERYFVLGYAGLFAGAVAATLADFTGLERWPMYFFQMGAFWQAALLALALGSRFFKLDPVTGVQSRRAFDDGLFRAWRAASAQHTGLAVVVIAIHSLKEHEALCGRMAGGALLRRVATLTAACCRDRADVFARYGDEAFAAIVPRISRTEVDAMAERIRATVRSIAEITIGVGVASIDEAHSAKGIVYRAAKRSVRDAIGQAAPLDAVAL